MSFSEAIIKKIGLPGILERQDNKSAVGTVEALEGSEFLACYFSAHWCDNSKSEYDEYFGGMTSFFSAGFESPEKEAMGSKYGVEGIPTLIIFDKEGNVVTDKGTSKLMRDEAGSSFPWRPTPVTELLAKAFPVVDQEGASTPFSAFQDLEAVGLYFSAHWCPPCKKFTPVLSKWYSSHIASGPLKGRAEVIFISSDKSAGEFAEYHADMSFKAMPFASRDVAAELKEVYGVQGIPSLIFVNPKTGAVVCENGRGKVEESPEDFPWPAKARENLDAALDSINEVATALLFTDKCADAVVEVAAVEAFDAVAASFFKEGKADERIRFGLASATDGEQALRLRGFLGAAMAATPSTAVIVVVDVPKRKKAIMPVPAAYSAADITAFINDYLAGKGSIVGLKE